MVVSRALCSNSGHLMKATKNIIENEGEGMIMRKVGSFYKRGRSLDLIKFKVLVSVLFSTH